MANTKITNHIVDKTLITGQTAVTAADGDYLLVADASDSSALKKVLASDLIQTSEEVADIVGAMVSSNTESGITVAYQDADNTIDFTVGTLNQNTTGSAATLTTARTIGGTSFDGSANIAVGLAATATALATSRTIHGVGFDGSANIDLAEVIQDTVGAMVASNTETNITVTYQDADGTLDFVVDAAQPNVTSLGTLTTLTVDDITINGSTISDAGDLLIDVEGDITLDANGEDIRFKDNGTQSFVFTQGVGSTIAVPRGSLTIDCAGDILLDADGGDIKFQDGGTEIGSISMSGSNVSIISAVQDEDIFFKGNDGGSVIDALTLDMSAAGAATFNDKIIATELDISGNCDIDGTTNLDVVDIDGAVDMASTLDVTGATALGHTLSVAEAATFTEAVIASKSARITQVAITSGSGAVAWDANAAANAYHVTTENTTISAPGNAVEGAVIAVEIAQGGTARTIAWNTIFEFAGSEAPTITATASKTDILAFRYNGSVWQEIGRVQNMAQT